MSLTTAEAAEVPTNVDTVTERRPSTFGQRLAWFGGKALDFAERIGEGVASFLGKYLIIYIF